MTNLVRDAFRGHRALQATVTAAFQARVAAWAKKHKRQVYYCDVMGVQWFEVGSDSIYQTSVVDGEGNDISHERCSAEAQRVRAPLVQLLNDFADIEELGLDFGPCITYDERGREVPKPE